jgi:CxxC motif-containing protein (DUF1111 family)
MQESAGITDREAHVRAMRTAALMLGPVGLALAGALIAADGDARQALALAGGALTTAEAGPRAYEQLSLTLSQAEYRQIADGRTFYDTRWAFYWFEQGLWGRGPTSNADACATCHRANGRGAPPREGDRADTFVVQIGVPGNGANGGPQPHPNYGVQLQTQGVPRLIAPEARIAFDWRTHTERFADGETVELRAPQVRIEDLAYGPLGDDIMISARVAPPVIGMGLLDAVPEDAILSLAARAAPEGVSGRPNRVWDVERKRVALGRFGLKANHPTLRQQVAAAFIEDIGLSTDLFPDQNCPGAQQYCREMMVAGKPEITEYRLKAVESLLRFSAVPARRNPEDAGVRRGEMVFAQAHCAACHVPELRTGEVPGQPALSNQVILPYTDLLLHDMGEALADHRPDFEASGREWRTPPLWGIGLTQTVNGNANYLHDGRARTLIEAILWHGGEAAASREAFRAMPGAEREALLRFLESL